ncbi:MAG TPA: hypothetical protein VH392_04720 [Sphingomicrobium sp.]
MAHGYLGDGYGSHGEADDRERDRNWRDRDENWRDRTRGRMFGGWDRGNSNDDRWTDRGRERFSANPDDHYRAWRDRHMSELDRDYAEYCREREQQFHRDFDDWRTQRQGNPGPLRTGMTQTGISHDPSGELELTDPAKAGQAETDPMDAATLGTTTRGSRRR